MTTLFLVGGVFFWVLIAVAVILILVSTEMEKSNSWSWIVVAITLIALYAGGNRELFFDWLRS